MKSAVPCRGEIFKNHQKNTIDAIKNHSHTKPGMAWLHGSGCLACSNHRTEVLLSPTSYFPGVFTLLQTTTFQSQLDADSTKWNKNGIAIWFLKTKIRKKPTTQFICNNRIKVAPQGKNLEKSLESTASFFLCAPTRMPALYGRANTFPHANGQF